ncbi:MAG: hypothetical protein AAGF67_02640 [Verrucomicrobiota bacterium]
MSKTTTVAAVIGIPFLIILIGVSSAAFIAVKQIPALLEETNRGLLPEGFEVRLPAAGDYTLWLHEKGRFGGEMYRSTGEVPPGAKIFLFESASGREIDLKKEVSAEKNLGEDRAISLGVFKGEREGQKIEIKSTGLNSDLLLSISQSSSRQIMGMVILIAGILLGSLVLATIFFIQLVRRRKATMMEGTA